MSRLKRHHTDHTTHKTRGRWLPGFLVLLMIMVSAGFINGQPLDSAVVNPFDSALAQFAALPQLSHASWGFCAIDTDSDKVYRSLGENISLIPASTIKPFTSSAVIAQLGRGYRFRTEVKRSGTTDSLGVLHGNLYLSGGGDPTLGSFRFGARTSLDSLFNRIYILLKDSGITTIEGAIIADEPGFPGLTVVPSWQYEDVGQSYGAPVSGLNIYENSLSFIFEPGKNYGSSARLTGTFPSLPYLELVNSVTIGPKGSGENVTIYGAPYSGLRMLEGTVPAGVRQISVSGTNPDPAYAAVFLLHEFLTAMGICVNNAPTTSQRMARMGEMDTLIKTTLLVQESPPLSEILYHLNMKSVNLYAEALVKILGRELYATGTTEAGIEGVYAFWRSRGLDLSGVKLRDGSGLSRKNLITPITLARALTIISKESWYPEVYASLPVAGESGSVAEQFRKSVAKGNLRAKSGTLEGVKNFCGYATTASGRKLAYALMVNNYSGASWEMVAEMEKLLILLCESKD